jgi:hypothetical protein
MYWGGVLGTRQRNLGVPHTDFGHSIKTLWLTYRVGLLTGDQALVEFAKPRIAELIDLAYIPKTGSWARGFKKDLTASGWVLDHDKEWWSFAEFDQTAGTMALVDPAYAAILVKTFDYWFRYMVDHKDGEVWHMVLAEGNRPDSNFPKIHSWKNGFHSHEHALICYLVSEQLHDRPVKLYFAFKLWPNSDTVYPYLFRGKLDTSKKSAGDAFRDPALNAYKSQIVWFSDLR